MRADCWRFTSSASRALWRRCTHEEQALLGAELSVDATALAWLTAEEAQSMWNVDVSELLRAHGRVKGPTKQCVGSKACDLFIKRERTYIAK